MKGKITAKNVILIMSGGVGSRFGADCPKQYCMIGGKQIIENEFSKDHHVEKREQWPKVFA